MRCPWGNTSLQTFTVLSNFSGLMPQPQQLSYCCLQFVQSTLNGWRSHVLIACWAFFPWPAGHKSQCFSCISTQPDHLCYVNIWSYNTCSIFSDSYDNMLLIFSVVRTLLLFQIASTNHYTVQSHTAYSQNQDCESIENWMVLLQNSE